MWTKARITAYAASAIVAVATITSMVGAATFDSVTGMYDLAPINIYSLLGITAPVGTTGLALVAVLLGWGKK